MAVPVGLSGLEWYLAIARAVRLRVLTAVRVNQLGRAPGQRHDRRVGVARYQPGHYGTVNDAQSLNAVHLQPRIDHSVYVTAHATRRHRVSAAQRTDPKRIENFVVRDAKRARHQLVTNISLQGRLTHVP